MKQISVIFFLITYSTFFGQSNVDMLENAYQEKSETMYNQFLQKWENDSKPIIVSDSLNELQKDIYQIFIDFYNPFKLERIGTGEWGKKLYYGIEYIVVQNSIYTQTYKTDSLNFGIFDVKDSLIESTDSIMNFRPEIKLKQAKTLYLLPEYNVAINRFLGNEHNPLGTGGIMNPATPKDSSAERLDFLNKKLKIIYGHWGGYWHIETHPQVFSIVFNKDRTLAKVNYRLVYQGGEAIYKKVSGRWNFLNAHLTWIE